MNLFTKAILSAAIIGVALTGCGEKKDNHLKVGAIAGAETQVAEEAAKIAKEKFGLEVEIVQFSDFATPNVALNDGSIVAVGNTFVYPIAGYSKKIKAVSELKEGSQIAVPNDPTNLGRSLLLLQKQGLLKLKDGAGLTATVLDIVENPKKVKIVELEAAQLPRALEDVDLAIINTVYASQVNLQPARDGLFVEDKESPYVNLIVARENNQNDEKVKNFVKSYQDEAVFKKATELFNGGVVKGW